MLSSKHITKITMVLISVTLILCILAMGYSDKLQPLVGETVYSMEYPSQLFDTDKILNVEIIMDGDSWNEMLENAISEEYYQCDVVINDTTFYSVGIRPKGNTSLSSIVSDPENNRYSFKLEFDRFVDGQTCFGLDKLVLNNNYADATNMKEAIIYDMYAFIGADAPLYNYAKISVNGDYWGVYLALEAVEESFMLRNYGTEKGYLYKPDGMNHNGGERENFDGNFPEMTEEMKERIKENMQNREAAVPEMPAEGEFRGRGGFGGGPGRGGNGSDLNYTDSSLDSYSTIWEGAVTGSTDADHKRVVEALKNINEKNELEKYADVDNILKYMAVHNFAVNDDSLSGQMAHNYYLYEAGGKLNIIPWDYNLSFGGMGGGSGSGVINEPIDDSYSSTKFFDFVLENEEYKARYHEYYNKLVEEYLYGGKFEEAYQRIRNQIDTLVENDPNAMYSYDEYLKAAEMFYKVIMLRSESVKGQLDGTIPSTSEGQRADSSALVDASGINLSDMGQMGGGRQR